MPKLRGGALVAATYFSINIITVARQKAEKQAKAKLSNASRRKSTKQKLEKSAKNLMMAGGVVNMHIFIYIANCPKV